MLALPHTIPAREPREQPSDWLDVFDPQVPVPQVRVVTLRERVPVASQVPLNPPQLLHGPVDVEPQLTPSVLREHPSDCVDVFEPQVPLPHVRVVTERDRLPVSSHVPLKPPQLLQAPVVVDPQLTPSVFREHAPV